MNAFHKHLPFKVNGKYEHPFIEPYRKDNAWKKMNVFASSKFSRGKVNLTLLQVINKNQ